jgi:2Fe-2S ferredoxin
VYINDEYLAALPPMKDDENELLGSASHRQPNSHLSCQIPRSNSLDGLGVTIAPES